MSAVFLMINVNLPVTFYLVLKIFGAFVLFHIPEWQVTENEFSYEFFNLYKLKGDDG